MMISKITRTLLWPFTDGRSLVTAFLACGSYVVVSIPLGGTAAFGKFVNGRYFLGDDGIFVQVPAWVYQYSQVHGWLALLLLVVAAIAGYKERQDVD